jgi:hypothetical protein
LVLVGAPSLLREGRSPSIPGAGHPLRSTQSVFGYVTVRPEASRCFPSHSPTLRPWIGRTQLC